MKPPPFLYFLLALFSGSSHYAEIGIDDLERAFILNSAPSFQGYFYKGSDKEFHYFRSKWKWRMDEYFKLKVEHFSVFEQFNFGSQELHISLSEQGDEFGCNEYHRLYLANIKQKPKQ